MSSETTNIGLVLPELPEAFDLERHWNHNSRIIDAEVGAAKQTIAEHTQDIEGLKQTTTAQGQLIAGKQDELTFDSTPASGSNNPVTSAGIHDDQQRQETEIGAVAAQGAKNLLKFTGQTQTLNGVTFTVNSDQTVSLSGTATATATFVIADNSAATQIPNGNYIMTGCPAGGGNTTFDLRWYLYSSGKSAYDQGSGASIAKSGNTTSSNIAILIRSGVNTDGLVFRPMIRRAEITDSTFVPYAPTNRELYEEKNKLQASLDQITGLGNQIPSNADLDTYSDPGVFQILSSAIAQTLVNIPADCKVAGSIEVKRLNGSAIIQFYYPNWASSGTNPGSFYFRQRTGATAWTSWYYFSGTQAASASTQSAPASLMQAGRIDAAEMTASEVTDDA